MTQDASASVTPDVIVRPTPASIVDAAHSFHQRTGSLDRAQETRARLGLSTGRPIVMTGHQASWWHPGILAKFFACDALARRLGAAPAWIVPDQDEQNFDTLEIPVRDGADRLAIEHLRVTASPPSGAPVAALPPFTTRPLSPARAPAWASVTGGLDRLRRAGDDHTDEPNAARQIAGALADLMSLWIEPAPTLFATGLVRAPMFREIVERLRDEADRATAIYNDAVAATAHAHVGALERDPAQGRFELPLWRVRPGRPRVTIWSDGLTDIPIEEIAPKALLMTGFLRLCCADLFIHGTGGEAYDHATEEWFEGWLGQSLAPRLTVSATLMLPIADGAPSPREAEAALWRARHARHHPMDLDLPDLQQRRETLVRTITAAPRRSAARSRAFHDLHDLLDDYRRAQAPRLAALEARAEEMRGRLTESEIAHRRTWAFFLHEPDAIAALQQTLRTAVRPEPAQAALCGTPRA